MLEADLSIRLAGRMDDDEISRMAGRTERLFDALVQRFGDTHQREAVNRDRGAVRDDGDRFADRGESHPPS